MGTYRDDLEAARSRIRVLETELEERDDEISALLGPDAADARRGARRGRRHGEDDGDYRSDALENLRAADERHNTRIQLAACLTILLAIGALGVGTFYTILTLMSYVVD